jgi:pSer/pThr/pTyr-binding forkhead associated (FHA) protein
MSGPAGPHSASASELKARLEAERRGEPFLIVRDETGRQRLLTLDEAHSPLTVGRSDDCRLPLRWDRRVSWVHAEFEKVGPRWTVSDGGLSRNGTYLNGERITERRGLKDGDTLRFGATAMVYRQPSAAPGERATTVLDRELPSAAEVSAAQKAVLRALCRPFATATPGRSTRPASNQDIAQELVLSLDAVKGHLRVLFGKFGLEGLPQNEKRLRLAERALESGTVTLAELRPPASP